MPIIKFCHIEELLQQPEMSGTESPDSATFDVEAEWIECPLKTPTPTPEIVSTFLIHPDMVELTTGL